MKLLTAFYDLEHGPVSYDFVTWLIRALQERERRECTALHVVVVPKEDGLGGFSRHWGPHDEHAARWRLWHIVLPACALAGATVSIAASRHQAHQVASEPFWWPQGKAHLAAPIVEGARRGEHVPRLAATPAAKRYVAVWLPQGAVTLTLRNQSNDTSRNASRDDWQALSAWLSLEKKKRLVWLDDTNVALERGKGYAELDIDLRLALYEHAAMNVVGNNGPAALLWHSAAPYMRVGAGIPSDWSSNLGLRQGEQIPWATKDQILVYGPDSFDVMREAFIRWDGATS